jgi:hypothetical protein
MKPYPLGSSRANTGAVPRYLVDCFWGLVVTVGIVHRVVRHLLRRRLANTQVDVESTGPLSRVKKPSTLFNCYHWVRTFLIVPGALRPYRSRLFYWCSIPTRMETIVIGLYWSFSIISSSITYEAIDGNLM